MTAESTYPREPVTDKRGRVCDPNNGRPLRDRDNRPYGKAPFKGKPGKLNPKTVARLSRRVAAFEEQKDPKGVKRPGSQKKS